MLASASASEWGCCGAAGGAFPLAGCYNINCRSLQVPRWPAWRRAAAPALRPALQVSKAPVQPRCSSGRRPGADPMSRAIRQAGCASGGSGAGGGATPLPTRSLLSLLRPASQPCAPRAQQPPSSSMPRQRAGGPLPAA